MNSVIKIFRVNYHFVAIVYVKLNAVVSSHRGDYNRQLPEYAKYYGTFT